MKPKGYQRKNVKGFRKHAGFMRKFDSRGGNPDNSTSQAHFKCLWRSFREWTKEEFFDFLGYKPYHWDFKTLRQMIRIYFTHEGKLPPKIEFCPLFRNKISLQDYELYEPLFVAIMKKDFKLMRADGNDSRRFEGFDIKGYHAAMKLLSASDSPNLEKSARLLEHHIVDHLMFRCDKPYLVKTNLIFKDFVSKTPAKASEARYFLSHTRRLSRKLFKMITEAMIQSQYWKERREEIPRIVEAAAECAGLVIDYDDQTSTYSALESWTFCP